MPAGWAALGAAAIGATTSTVADGDQASGQDPLPACEFTLADDAELRRRVKAFAEKVPDYDMVMDRCH